MKVCYTCKEEKDEQDFSKESNGRVRYICRVCDAKRSKEWRENHPEKGREYSRRNYYKYPERKKSPLKAKDQMLRREYGITLEQYNHMLSKQGGVCLLCGKSQGCNGKALNVDHDHKTGVVRGLLCSNCNTGIGLLQESPTLLLSAVAYLQKFEGVQYAQQEQEARLGS